MANCCSNSGGRQLLEIPKKAVARVIHENVDAAKFLNGFIDCAFCLLLVRNVERDESEIVVRTLKSAPQLFKIAAGCHHPVTRFQGRLGGISADAASRTCYEPDFTHVLRLPGELFLKSRVAGTMPATRFEADQTV